MQDSGDRQGELSICGQRKGGTIGSDALSDGEQREGEGGGCIRTTPRVLWRVSVLSGRQCLSTVRRWGGL